MAGGTGKGGYTAADIRAALPTDEEIYNLAELFKVFGDSTRTKILSCLQTVLSMCPNLRRRST